MVTIYSLYENKQVSKREVGSKILGLKRDKYTNSEALRAKLGVPCKEKFFFRILPEVGHSASIHVKV